MKQKWNVWNRETYSWALNESVDSEQAALEAAAPLIRYWIKHGHPDRYVVAMQGEIEELEENE